jgi:hypothetical protein
MRRAKVVRLDPDGWVLSGFPSLAFKINTEPETPYVQKNSKSSDLLLWMRTVPSAGTQGEAEQKISNPMPPPPWLVPGSPQRNF